MANQHVIKHLDGWQVKGSGNSRATGVFNTQKKAFERAREIAINQKAEVLIHGKDGKIREKKSYGNDPRNIKG